jgi:hypothetical protein
MDQPPTLPPSLPPQAAANKGMSPIAWLGIGCGGLLLICAAIGIYAFFIVKKKIGEFAANPEKALAESVIAMNPEFKKLSQDDQKGTMTIRTKNGEELTFSYKDIAEGKIMLKDKDGNTTRIGSANLSQVPAWVPMVPDLSDGISMFHSEAANEISGQFSGKSARTAEDLRAFFEGEAASLELENESSGSTQADGTSMITLGFSGSGKSLTIVIIEKPGEGSLVNTTYSEKK